MTRLWRTGALLCAVIMLAGCGKIDRRAKTAGDYKPKSQGAPYELVVVADHDQWDGQVGDTLRSIFYKQYPMVSHQETLYDVLRVRPGGFKRFITRHPNILMINVDEKNETSGMQLQYDVYASPQIVIVASAADNASLAELIDANREEILILLERAERERTLNNTKYHAPKQVKALIKEKFGFDMDVTPGFTVRSDKENLLWMSYEMPMSSQGVIIYTYPFSGTRDFLQDNLIRRRDQFVSLIPGENPGSHMATNPDFVELGYKQINGRSWSEMHGFWDVVGDFMGGPYVNYSTFDAANQRVIAIDLYVYSPSQTNTKLSQRNYKKQLEHFIYSVNIPEPDFN